MGKDHLVYCLNECCDWAFKSDRTTSAFFHPLGRPGAGHVTPSPSYFLKRNGKTDPYNMDVVLFIRVRQNLKGLRAFELDNNTTLHLLEHWNGRYKISMKRLKDKSRRD